MPDLGSGMWCARFSPAPIPCFAESAFRAHCVKTVLCEVYPLFLPNILGIMLSKDAALGELINMKIALSRKSLVPISDLSNSFSKYYRKLKAQSEPLFIMKNNSIEAVMLNVEDYERLLEAQEMYEELQLADIALRRLEKPTLGQDFEEILAERGLSIESIQD